MNGVIVVGSGLQAVPAPQQKLCQKVGMYFDQLVQAGKQGVHGAGLQLKLLQHALPKHPLHDLQRPHVVQLCLNQL